MCWQGPILHRINEHPCENTNGIHPCAEKCSLTKLCLDEVIAENVDTIGATSSMTNTELSPEMWLNLEVSDYYAQKENIMWENMVRYVEKGNEYISLLHNFKWFRGSGRLYP